MPREDQFIVAGSEITCKGPPPTTSSDFLIRANLPDA